MINKIVASFLLLCLMIAISIKCIDSSIEYVSISGPFLSFLKTCSYDLNSFKIEIPSIPQIPNVENNWGLDFLINIINGIVTVLNILINIINILISLIQFLIIMIRNLVTMRDDIFDNATSEPVVSYCISLN